MAMPGLLVLLLAATAARAQPALHTVELFAPSVGRTMRYDVVLPPGYHDPANAARRYPTLYLLHDVGGHAGDWHAVVDRSGARRELILVMPDAGDSYYVDWAQSDDARPHRWATYIVDDVRRHVEATFRALERRDARAVTGRGMGGYGALVLGLRHPDRFVSIGSQSGDLWWARAAAERMRLGGPARPRVRDSPQVEAARRRTRPTRGVPGFRRLIDRTPRGQPFLTPADADAHDPFMLVMRVARDRMPFIQLDIALTAPAVEASRALATQLLDADHPVTVTQQRGGRDEADWAAIYEDVIASHHRVMARALAAAR